MKNKKRTYGNMREIIFPYRFKILLIVGLAALRSLLDVSMAVVIKYVIDAAVAGNGVLFWGSVLMLNILAIVLLYILEHWCANSYADKMTAQLRGDLLTSAVYSRGAKLQSFHSGELLSRGMEDVNTVCNGALNVLPSLAAQIARLVGSFVAVLMIQPIVALVLVMIAVAAVFSATVLRPKMKHHQSAVRKADEQVLSNMQENLQQLELIHSLQVQGQVLKRFFVKLKESLKRKFYQRCWAVGISGVVTGVAYLGTGTVLLWGAVQLGAGVITYGDLSSVLELLALFRGPMLGISGQWSRLIAVEVACERLLDMLDGAGEQSEPEQKEIAPTAVVFENVTFGYPGEEHHVLENFNAEFPLNGWACLTGISGRGKSTLFKLILGLYEPQEGRVYLKTEEGDIPCSEQTRHLFAYVPQDYAMLSGTVLENLLLVAPEADEQTRRQAIHLAGADFIWDTTLGEETYMGENNTGLSKGQIQRLAIARAILMDRKIFLLDECTSALDDQTEYTVIHNLQKLSKSAILVTHRPQVVETVENVKFIPMDK